MATLNETIDALQKLAASGGSGITLNYDEVVKEQIRIYYEQADIPFTEEDIEKVKKVDYDNNPRVKAFIKQKISEFKAKTSSMIKNIQNIPTQFSGIAATAADVKAAPAAVPMYVGIKNSVNEISSQLADNLSICSDLGIGAPNELISLVDKVATLKSLVGA